VIDRLLLTLTLKLTLRYKSVSFYGSTSEPCSQHFTRFCREQPFGLTVIHDSFEWHQTEIATQTAACIRYRYA